LIKLTACRSVFKCKFNITFYHTQVRLVNRDQKRFTLSEVVADWHELTIPKRTMQPSVAHANEQLDPRCSQSATPCSPYSV